MAVDGEYPDDLLLVEDNPGDLRLVEEAFDERAIETTLHAVSTGEAAIEFVYQRGAFENAPEPDVILLDWNLRKMDGEAVLTEIEPAVSDVPVVVMTGTQSKAAIVESEGPRADAYLTKPSDPGEYVDVVLSVY